jgi:hypothetical protein
LPQVLHSIRVGAVSFILMVCRRLVRAFDVFDLGTAIVKNLALRNNGAVQGQPGHGTVSYIATIANPPAFDKPPQSAQGLHRLMR